MATQRSKKVTGKSAKKTSPSSDRNPKLLVDDITAILLVSPNATKLSEFYKATLGLPLVDELHDGMPVHYGCELGDVHFAIHPKEGGWPGALHRNSQSPVISFSSSNLKAVTKKLSDRGVKVTGPNDHGFANVISFRDPDGNHVSIVEYRPESW